MLSFIEPFGKNKNNKKISLYQCSCGDISEYIDTVVKNKRVINCKKCSNMINAKKRTSLLAGKKIGEWEIIKQVTSPFKNRGSAFECRCSCGDIHIVRSSDLSQKKSTKCEKCRINESKEIINNKSYFKNFKSADNNRLYRIWKNIKTRCYSKNYNTRFYKNIGVTMCDEWRNDFMSFYNWAMDNGYKDTLEIDKDYLCDHFGISPKIYSPQTCIWITKKENVTYSSLNDLIIKRRIRDGLLQQRGII